MQKRYEFLVFNCDMPPSWFFEDGNPHHSFPLLLACYEAIPPDVEELIEAADATGRRYLRLDEVGALGFEIKAHSLKDKYEPELLIMQREVVERELGIMGFPDTVRAPIENWGKDD